MNLEQVAQFVKNPQQLDLSHTESLKSLSDKNPYTTIYSLLYLTALSNGKSPDLDEALAHYAFKISDRTRLYHLIKGEKEDEFSHEIFSDQILPTDPSADERSQQSEIKNILSASVIENSQTTEKTKIENENPEIENSEIHRKTEEEIGLDFERVTTAHSLEQFLEVEITDESESSESVYIDEEEKVSEPIEIVSDQEPEKPITIDSGFKSFNSWLKSGSSEPEKASEPEVKTKPNELIEKFLQEEPSISRLKKEFYSPSRKAKESLSEDAVPVSETLAKIYAAQGNYPKAIHVYHQLMLSFPEKKSLFAVQIEELKKKITP